MRKKCRNDKLGNEELALDLDAWDGGTYRTFYVEIVKFLN